MSVRHGRQYPLWRGIQRDRCLRRCMEALSTRWESISRSSWPMSGSQDRLLVSLDAEPISGEDLLVQPCDILLPAATENQITHENADRIQARVICEGANGPTTAQADEILYDKKVFIIPDILANAGGVTVSYFEWVQDRQGYFWNLKTVNERLEEIMVNSFDTVAAYADRHNVNMRIAAYMLAIDRVAFTISERGIYA